MLKRLGSAARVGAGWVGQRFWQWTAHSVGLAGIEDTPELASLLALWRQARAALPGGGTSAGPLPWVDRIERGALGPLIPYMAVVDLSQGVTDARYRLVGPALVRLFGRDPTGEYLTELYRGTVLREVQAAYTKVSMSREPLYSTREFQILGRSFGYRRLILPLSRDRDSMAVTHGLLGLVPASRDLRDAQQWRSAQEELEMMERLETGTI